MGQARLRGSFQDRLIAAYNKKLHNAGLQAKTIEQIAEEAEVPSDSIGQGYVIYFANEHKFLSEQGIKVDIPAYAKIYTDYEEIISTAIILNKQSKVEIYYLFDCNELQKQYVVKVISLNK